MIKTKEDFETKCIKLPKDISRKKFEEIQKKLEKIGCNNLEYIKYSDVGEYLYISKNECNSYLTMWSTVEGYDREEFTVEQFLGEDMIIRTKEDFKGKYIKLRKNISEEKFDKVKEKLRKMGFNLGYIKYYRVNFRNSHIYLFIDKEGDIGNWTEGFREDYRNDLQLITINQFLGEAMTTKRKGLINKREDFLNKYIKLSKDISKEKFDEMIERFKELDMNTSSAYFSRTGRGDIYVRTYWMGDETSIETSPESRSGSEEISLEDFLGIERTFENSLKALLWLMEDEKNIIKFENDGDDYYMRYNDEEFQYLEATYKDDEDEEDSWRRENSDDLYQIMNDWTDIKSYHSYGATLKEALESKKDFIMEDENYTFSKDGVLLKDEKPLSFAEIQDLTEKESKTNVKYV